MISKASLNMIEWLFVVTIVLTLIFNIFLFVVIYVVLVYIHKFHILPKIYVLGNKGGNRYDA